MRAMSRRALFRLRRCRATAPHAPPPADTGSCGHAHRSVAVRPRVPRRPVRHEVCRGRVGRARREAPTTGRLQSARGRSGASACGRRSVDLNTGASRSSRRVGVTPEVVARAIRFERSSWWRRARSWGVRSRLRRSVVLLPTPNGWPSPVEAEPTRPPGRPAGTVIAPMVSDRVGDDPGRRRDRLRSATSFSPSQPPTDRWAPDASGRFGRRAGGQVRRLASRQPTLMVMLIVVPTPDGTATDRSFDTGSCGLASGTAIAAIAAGAASSATAGEHPASRGCLGSSRCR